MFPYLLLLLLPSMFALFNARKLSLTLWYLTFVIYVVFVGLRFEVGPDWAQYSYIHSNLAFLSFSEILAQAEPLSYLLFWISETSGYHLYITNIVAALIMMSGVFAFARRTANPWLALVAATPYFIIVMGMSGVRQSMAAGIILFLFSRWERYSLIRRGVYILIAAMFHTSALINNVLLIVKLNIPLRYKIVLGSLVVAGTLYLGFGVSMYAENFARYQERYLKESMIAESIGSMYHIIMIIVPAVLAYIYRRRIVGSIYSLPLLNFGLYASLGVFLLNFYSTTAASRLTLYLYFLPMMVYPALVNVPGRRPDGGTMMAVIGVHMLILIAWFQLANVSFAYIPYQNALFNVD